MFKLAYILGAQGCSIDRDTNAVSLFNLIEGVQAATFPIAVPVVIVSLVEFAPAETQREFRAVMKATSPRGQFETPIAMPVAPGATRHRLFQRYEPLGIMGPGNITFELTIEGERVAEFVLLVEQVPDVALEDATTVVTH